MPDEQTTRSKSGSQAADEKLATLKGNMALPAACATHEPDGLGHTMGVANAVSLFPFTINCDDRGWSSYDFRAAFCAHKPKGLSWYAYDVMLHSPDSVEFIVYAMRCNLRGGVGPEIARFKCDVPLSMSRSAIERRAERLAREARRAELESAEEAIIKRYASAILMACAPRPNQDTPHE